MDKVINWLFYLTLASVLVISMYYFGMNLWNIQLL